MNIPPPLAPPADPLAARDHALREAAVKLEAGFLKQMLSEAGLGRAPGGMGGGAGEDQFASFLLEEQALRMARSGGIGLAESLFQALKARDAA
ncbi:rod-binding protein [Rubellimicrobium aerolatum]|uniref:Rod-binding protein n=1 Tax=Rubellimicrobium aerolatum TaxID=490979 RepID=A0ABW0S9T2_9RHOB|nr:rod-binding protein [Rubellimicrobium aerolatum]MBP1805058.1 Rod binding domain-containing protein [Rubellimicrobium aerolatum]